MGQQIKRNAGFITAESNDHGFSVPIELEEFIDFITDILAEEIISEHVNSCDNPDVRLNMKKS